MSFRSLLRKVFRLAWLPIVCAVIAGGIASVLVADSPTEYRSTLLLVIPSSQARPDLGDSASTSTTADVIGRPSEAVRLAAIYAELIPNDSNTLSAVAQAAELSEDDVRGEVTAIAVPDSSLIQLQYTAPTPEQSEAGIRALQDALTGVIPTNDAISPGSLVLVSTDGPVETSSSNAYLVPSAVVLGLAFGGFLAIVWARAVPRMDDASEVRAVVEVPVLDIRPTEPPGYLTSLLKGRKVEPGVHIGFLGVSRGAGVTAEGIAARVEYDDGVGDRSIEEGLVGGVVVGSVGELSALAAVGDSDVAVIVVCAGDRQEDLDQATASLDRSDTPLLGVLFVDEPVYRALPGLRSTSGVKEMAPADEPRVSEAW